MAFDTKRAFEVIRKHPASFLDRILGYMYFSDLDIIERTEWDIFGGGSTFIGTKGDQHLPTGFLMASPFPLSLDFLTATPPLSLAHQFDMIRLVDLIAKLWAVSEFDTTVHQSSLHLAVYRSSPFADALDSMLDHIIPLRTRHLILHASIGDQPVHSSLAHATIAFEARAKGPFTPFPTHETRAFSYMPSHDLATPQLFLTNFLQEISQLDQATMQIADLQPAQGYDFLPPMQINFRISMAQQHFPDDWTPIQEELHIPPAWKGLHNSLCTAAVFVSALEREIASTWLQPPLDMPFCMPIALSRWEDSVQLLIAATFPPIKERHPESSMEDVLTKINQKVSSPNVPCRSRLLSFSNPTSPLPFHRNIQFPLGMSAIGVRHDVVTSLMGPTLSEMQEEPHKVALHYGKQYLRLLHALCEENV